MKREIPIKLQTPDIQEANRRRLQVIQAEDAILLGDDISFPWMNSDKKLKIKSYTLKKAIDDYLKHKISIRLAESSITRISVALSHFKNFIGEDIDVRSITTNEIDSFTIYCSNQTNHKPNTINNNLCKIGTFLKYLLSRNKIKSVSKITKVRVSQSNPKYVTDDEWQQIMNLDKVYRKNYKYSEILDEHYKRAWYFYRETGLRKGEPFEGMLNGNTLIIEGDDAKSKKQREIYIPDELLRILAEMRFRVNNSKAKNKQNSIDMYSRKFRFACYTLQIKKHLHCLRNTYAVRRYLETGDLYLVSKELGHSEITTTERYANYHISRLEKDFPSIIASDKLKVYPKISTDSYMKHRIQLS